MLSSSDILILTLVGVLALAFLVFAGLALSVRSFTVLTELIQRLGLQVVQQHQETRQVQTTLLDELGNVANSVKENGSHSTPEKADYPGGNRGSTEMK